jgi:hypothetical protein
MADANDKYEWITAGDSEIRYRRLIASGGFGDVHEVP